MFFFYHRRETQLETTQRNRVVHAEAETPSIHTHKQHSLCDTCGGCRVELEILLSVMTFDHNIIDNSASAMQTICNWVVMSSEPLDVCLEISTDRYAHLK